MRQTTFAKTIRTVCFDLLGEALRRRKGRANSGPSPASGTEGYTVFNGDNMKSKFERQADEILRKDAARRHDNQFVADVFQRDKRRRVAATLDRIRNSRRVTNLYPEYLKSPDRFLMTFPEFTKRLLIKLQDGTPLGGCRKRQAHHQ